MSILVWILNLVLHFNSLWPESVFLMRDFCACKMCWVNRATPAPSPKLLSLWTWEKDRWHSYWSPFLQQATCCYPVPVDFWFVILPFNSNFYEHGSNGKKGFMSILMSPWMSFVTGKWQWRNQMVWWRSKWSKNLFALSFWLNFFKISGCKVKFNFH